MGTEKWRKSSQESKIFALGGLRGVLAANPFAREVFFPRESKFAYEIALLHDYASANQLGSDDYCPALKVHAMKYNMRKLTRCWDRGGKLLRQVEHRASLPRPWVDRARAACHQRIHRRVPSSTPKALDARWHQVGEVRPKGAGTSRAIGLSTFAEPGQTVELSVFPPRRSARNSAAARRRLPSPLHRG
jgi:hypothetical protein